MLACLLLVACVQQNHNSSIKDWHEKYVYPAHDGKINVYFEDGSEVSWDSLKTQALKATARKKDWIEVVHKQKKGYVRLAEVVHENIAYDYYLAKVQDEPDKREWKYMHGYFMFNNYHEDAIKHLDEYIRSEPNYYFLILRGKQHYLRYDFEKAKADFDASLVLSNSTSPDDARHSWFSASFYYRGKVHAKRLQIDNARIEFKEARKRSHVPFLEVMELAKLDFDEKQYDQSLTQLNEALKLVQQLGEEERAYPYLYRAVVYLAKNDLKLAPDDLTTAINRTDITHSELYCAAWLLSTHPNDAIRNGTVALSLAKRAVEGDPKEPVYLAGLAAAYAETGEFAKAIETEQQALKDEKYQKYFGTAARARLALYEKKKPYRWRDMRFQGELMPGMR